MHILRILAALALPLTAAFATPKVPIAPKYLPLQFTEMAMSADLIVHGEIVVLTKESFTLEIETVLAGELSVEAKKTMRIEVRRFHDWACASRWIAYSPGQEVVLFLEMPAKDTTHYRILSAGGEGEMPVSTSTDACGKITRTVRVRGLGTESLEQVEQFYIGHLAPRGPKFISQANLEDLIHAVRELKRCFRIDVSKDAFGRTLIKTEAILAQPVIEKLRAHSKLGALVVEGARAHLPS